MDHEIWKAILQQGVGFAIMALVVKWLLNDRDKGWQVASNEQKERIVLLEATSINRTQELKELRTEFATYRNTTQIEFSAIHAKHSEQLISVTQAYNKQLDGLQTEIRGLYRTMLDLKMCPIGADLPSKDIIVAGQ